VALAAMPKTGAAQVEQAAIQAAAATFTNGLQQAAVAPEEETTLVHTVPAAAAALVFTVKVAQDKDSILPGTVKIVQEVVDTVVLEETVAATEKILGADLEKALITFMADNLAVAVADQAQAGLLAQATAATVLLELFGVIPYNVLGQALQLEIYNDCSFIY
jgi:hypothetical protein